MSTPHRQAGESAEDDFQSYLRNRLKRYLSLTTLAILSLPLYRLAASYLQTPPSGTDTPISNLFKISSADRAVMLGTQAALCFGLAFSFPKVTLRHFVQAPDDNPHSEEWVVAESLRRIARLFIGIFCLWGSYYVASAFFAGMECDGKDAPQLILLSVNLLPGLALFWVYLEMSLITVEPRTVGKDDQNRHMAVDDARRYQLISKVCGFAILATSACIFIAYSYQIMGTTAPLADRLAEALFGPSSPDTALTSAASKRSTALKILGVLVGISHAVSLAMVVGRMSSSRINPGPITIALLFAYSSIQPLAGFFSDAAIQAITTTVAMALKILLFATCSWMFESGRLEDFVRSVRPILEKKHIDRVKKSGGENTVEIPSQPPKKTQIPGGPLTP